MANISLNQAALGQQITIFEGHINGFDSSTIDYSLDNCEGATITKIDEAFEELNKMIPLLHSVMCASDNYLSKVQYNVNSCEVDNSVDGDK